MLTAETLAGILEGKEWILSTGESRLGTVNIRRALRWHHALYFTFHEPWKWLRPWRPNYSGEVQVLDVPESSQTVVWFYPNNNPRGTKPATRPAWSAYLVETRDGGQTLAFRTDLGKQIWTAKL